MKKRILLIACPLAVAAIVLGIFLWTNRKITYEVSAGSWDNNGSFVLCTIEVSSKNIDQFIPKDEQGFLKTAEAQVGYLGIRNYYLLGIRDNPCRMFYYNNGIYALMDWNDAVYQLRSCQARFSWFGKQNEVKELVFPAPGEFDGTSTQEHDSRAIEEFELSFGTYEDAVQYFYSHLDDSTVSFDPEQQLIRCVPYDQYAWKMVTDGYIVIDFVNKEVRWEKAEE